jgi:hypothetical protein
MAFSHTGESKNKEGGANRLLAAAVAGSLAFILAACESDTKSPSPNQDQTSASQDLDPTVPSAEQVMDQPQNYTEADLNALDKLSELTISDTEQAIQVSAEEALDVFRDPSQSPMSEFAEAYNRREGAIDFVDYVAVMINNLSSGNPEKIVNTMSFAGLSPEHLYDLYKESVKYATLRAEEGPTNPNAFKNGLRYGQVGVYEKSALLPENQQGGVYDFGAMLNQYGAAMAIAIVKSIETIDPNQIPEFKPYRADQYMMGDDTFDSADDLIGHWITEVAYTRYATPKPLIFNGEEINTDNLKIFWVDADGNFTDKLPVNPETLNDSNTSYVGVGPTAFTFLNMVPYKFGTLEPDSDYFTYE